MSKRINTKNFYCAFFCAIFAFVTLAQHPIPIRAAFGAPDSSFEIGGKINDVNVPAAPGDLDLTFGYGGIAQFQMSENFNPRVIEQQADGKLLVAGWTSPGERLVLRRHLSDGSLDTSFGLNGEAVADTDSAEFVYGIPYALAVQDDGKILAAGAYGSPVLWRFTSAGILDTSFGNGGVQSLSDSNGTAYAVGVYLSKIFVLYNYGSSYGALSRRNSNGSRDVLFNTVYLRQRSVTTHCGTLKIQPSNGAVYVGTCSNLARYNYNGTIDTSFSSDGIAPAPPSGICAPTSNFAFQSLDLQPNGKIVATGWRSDFFNYGYGIVVRYNADGLLDAPFNYPGDNCSENSLVQSTPRSKAKLQSDGRVMVMLQEPLRRLYINGMEDSTFNLDYSAFNWDFLVQSGDSKAVALGLASGGYQLARYLS